jgi:hypothetical protein
LTNAATVGDTITTISFYVSSVLNAIPATAGSVSSTYLVDGSVTQAKLSTNVAGNGPAFSSYISGNQTVTGGANTKLAFNTKEFDTANCYDATTNYRFTPTVAGYYQVIANANPYGNASPIRTILMLYKNGTLFKLLFDLNFFSTSYGYNNGFQGSALVYMNGSTDYLEVWGNMTIASGTAVWYGYNSTYSQFSAFLARSA